MDLLLRRRDMVKKNLRCKPEQQEQTVLAMPVTTRSGGGVVAPSPSQKSTRQRAIEDAENNNNVKLKKASGENNNSRPEAARKRANDAVKRIESANTSVSPAAPTAKASPRGKAGTKTPGATNTALKSTDEKPCGSTPKSNRKYPVRSTNGKGSHDSDEDDFCSSSLAKRGKKLISEGQDDQPVRTRRLRSMAIEKSSDDTNSKDSSTTSNDIEVNLPVKPSTRKKKETISREVTSAVTSPESSGRNGSAEALSTESLAPVANNEQCEEPTSPDSRSSSPRFHLWPPVNA